MKYEVLEQDSLIMLERNLIVLVIVFLILG